MLKKVKNYNIENLLDDFWKVPAINANKYASHFSMQLGTMDVSEDDKNYYVEIDVPNFDIDDIRIEVQDKKMIITGNVEQEKNERRYKIKERTYNSFSRSILFENVVNEEDVNAELQNGVLTISVAKTEKKNDKKNIVIKKH